MKVNELMVGNFVYNKDQQICKVLIVNGMFEGYVTVDNYSKDDGTFEELFENEISGIPITKEFLDKNEFTYEEETELYHLGNGLHLFYEEENGCYNVGIIGISMFGDEYQYVMNIHFVHELQNLLRLSGLITTLKFLKV